jgi:hypothetical protein
VLGEEIAGCQSHELGSACGYGVFALAIFDLHHPVMLCAAAYSVYYDRDLARPLICEACSETCRPPSSFTMATIAL